MCLCVFSSTLSIHKVGTQPRACSHAVLGVVEGEEVGRGGAGVSAPSVTLQLAGCDWLAQVHAGGTGNLQHFRISVNVHSSVHYAKPPLCVEECFPATFNL